MKILIAFLAFLMQTTSGGVTTAGGVTTRGAVVTASVPGYSSIHCINQVSTGTVSCSVTVASAGQTLVISSGQLNSGSTATLTDTNGTPTLCTGYPQVWNGSGNDYIWYETNVATGTHTFSAAWGPGSSAGFPNIMVAGATSGTTVTCGSALHAQGSGTTFTGATFSAGGAGLLLSFTAPNTGAMVSPGLSGAILTLIDQNGGLNPSDGYANISTGGSYFTTWSASGSSNYYVQEAFVQ